MANISEVLGRNIDSVKELKKAIGELQNSLIGLDAESKEFKDTSMKLAAAQDELTKVTKAGKEENVAATDSIVGMEQEYKKLYNTYKMLSDEQRNSDFGKNMAESLETLSTKLNETKQGVGNFKDNIGRYAGSVTEAFNKMGVSAGALQGPLKTATTGAKGFNTALKSLAANPVVLILATLVAILGKAADAIKNNEELTNRLKEAMAVFKPVLDAVSNAFDFLAGILVKTVEGLTKVASKIMSVIPGMKDAIKSHQDLAKATNDLTKAQRENSVVASEKQAEIERLREEASATDDVIEKKRLLEEAKAMQAEVDQKNIELAQEELRILQEYGEKTANSAEENEKLAAAQKKVNDAIAQGERNMRMYNKQLDATEKGTKSATSAGKNYREEAKKLYEQVVENSKTEIQKLTEKYEKEKKLLEKYHYDTKLLTKKYNEEIGKVMAEATKQQIAVRNQSLQEANRTAELLSEFYTPGQKEKQRLKDYLNGTTKRYNRFFDAYNDFLGEVIDKSTDLDYALDQINNSLNIQDFTNYTTVLDSLKAKIADASEAGWGDKAINKLKNAKKFLEDLGENGWVKLTKDVQKAANELSIMDGLSERTSANMQIAFEGLGKKLKESVADALADIHVGEKVGEEFRKELEEELNLLRGGFDEYQFGEIAAMNTYAYLDAQKEALRVELENFQGSQEKKLELMQQYYEVLREMRENDWADERLNVERQNAIWDASLDRFNAVADAYSSIIDVINSYMQSEIDSGKITKREADKKKKTIENLEKVQVAVAVAGIAAQTAGGIMDVWRGYAAELPVNAQTAAASGPAAAATKAALDAKSLAAAILRTSTLAIQGTTQIAAAIGGYIVKSNAASAESGSGDVGLGVTPALIDSTPYSYARVVQTEEDVQNLNQQPIWVSVTDIESGLGQRAQVVGESSF